MTDDVPDLDALAEEFAAQYEHGGCSDRVEELFHRAMDAARAFALRAESAEMGCAIAYRREPTEAEAEAFADGADETFVPMGGWTARRCRFCSRWVFGGPTACVRCVEREEVEKYRAKARVYGAIAFEFRQALLGILNTLDGTANTSRGFARAALEWRYSGRRGVAPEDVRAFVELLSAKEEVEGLKARIAELKVLVADGPAAERSAIVAWLRSELHEAVTPSEFATARALKHAADLIEENAHMAGGVASEDVGP